MNHVRYVALSDTISLAQRAVSALTTPGALTARQSGQSGRCPFPDESYLLAIYPRKAHSQQVMGRPLAHAILI